MTTFKTRREVPLEFQWNDTSLFATPADWQMELDRILNEITAFADWQGRLHDSASALAEALSAFADLLRAAGKVYLYAALQASVDTLDADAARRNTQAQSMFARLSSCVSFIDPELVALGQVQLETWTHTEPRLAIYAHYFDELFRQQPHIRSAEVEEVLGLASAPFSGTAQTRTVLSDGDLKFAPARSADGGEQPVTQGSFNALLANPDRSVRRSAWENFQDAHLAVKSTFASNLVTSIQQNIFSARVRRHPTTLDAALFNNNIPSAVFHNLIDTYRQRLPVWHRYWAVRRKILNVPTLAPYDVWAPLTTQRPSVPYAQAVQWICDGLAPLGDEYVSTLRRGCETERWIDVYPTPGKSSAEFSAGWPGTHPFIVMNYTDSLFGLSTLAHELGHSMHSYFTWQNQPYIYANYSIFVAEVASNFNQALVRSHLLRTQTDPHFQISLLEEAMSNFHRYFFIMPTLARFELEVHERLERGQGVTAEDMNALMADLFSEGFGSEMELDRERVGITWATFGHLYQDYYVYQYATGISGANALASRILAGESGAADAYLRFLKSGSSRYPLELLKDAGVDMSTPQPIEEAYDVLAGYIDRLEQLAGA